MILPESRPTLARPQSLRPCGAPPFTQGRLCSPLHGFKGSPLRGAPAQRVRGGREGRNQHPTTPQSPAVPPLTRPGPSAAARHLPTLWGVTPQGEPMMWAQPHDGCRGRRCGVAQRSMPQWGIEPHERASFAGWRRPLCAAKRRRPVQSCAAAKLHGRTRFAPTLSL